MVGVILLVGWLFSWLLKFIVGFGMCLFVNLF